MGGTHRLAGANTRFAPDQRREWKHRDLSRIKNTEWAWNRILNDEFSIEYPHTHTRTSREYTNVKPRRAHVHRRINRNIVEGLILARMLSSDFSLSLFHLSIQCNCTGGSLQGHEDLIVRYSHGPTKTMSSNRTVLEGVKGERENDLTLHCSSKHVPSMALNRMKCPEMEERSE